MHLDGIQKLTAKLGAQLDVSNIQPCEGLENCLVINEDTRLHILNDINKGFTITWLSQNINRVFQDCYDLNSSSVHWYGGPERYEQLWPVEKLKLENFINIVQEDGWGAIVEPYWLNSEGAYIYINEKVPLFIDQNNVNVKDGSVCFSAKAIAPYIARTRVRMQVQVQTKHT